MANIHASYASRQAGSTFKDSVITATTANITLSGTQTIDGISVAVGDRVLVKDQSTGSQNGIYTVASGSWSRSFDTPIGANVAGISVVVEQGTANGDKLWVCTSDAPNDIINTDSLTFTESGGGSSSVEAYSATVTSRAELVAAPGVSIAASEISIGPSTSTRIRIAGEIVLSTSEFIKVYSGSALIGVSVGDLASNVGGSKITGDLSAGAVLRYANVKIELCNIHVENTNTTTGSAACRLLNQGASTECLINNCKFTGNQGMLIDSCNYALIKNSVFSGLTGTTRTGGIVFDGGQSVNINIESNQFLHDAVGIWIDASENPKCKIVNNSFLKAGIGGTFNGTGIYFNSGSSSTDNRMVIQGNTFKAQTESVSNFGIEGGVNNTILNGLICIGNSIELGTGAVFIGGTTGFDLLNCQIVNNYSSDSSILSCVDLSFSLISGNTSVSGTVVTASNLVLRNRFIGNYCPGTSTVFNFTANAADAISGNTFSCNSGSTVIDLSNATTVRVFRHNVVSGSSNDGSTGLIFDCNGQNGAVDDCVVVGNYSRNAGFSDVPLNGTGFTTSIFRGNMQGFGVAITDFG